nr:beta-N-acetylhexosaminidase [Paenibacillus shirakamiensis]
MLDVSRNAVLTKESVEQFLEMTAIMGFDTFMLYTEDTYTIESQPYFGYMRGRYSEDEIKGFDDYADKLGIELIPCIQTLAHLATFLRWDTASTLKDTADVLIIGEEPTYAWIRQMIEAAQRPVRSRRIHIGMDEAHGLGLGRYLENYGYQNRFELMNRHLQQVLNITESLGLKPIIWSDMYFRLGSTTGEYYDLEGAIPPEVAAHIPEGVQLVYWDYYHEDEAFYEDYLDRHDELAPGTIFAGGVWTFAGIAPHYTKSFLSTHAALNSCKKKGVQEVLATIWLDDGAETPMITALPGLQLFAEHAYHAEMQDDQLAQRFQTCTGGDWDAFLTLGRLDCPPGANPHRLEPDNPSKYILWSDPFIGLFDHQLDVPALPEYYQQLASEAQSIAKEGTWSSLLSFYQQLALVLSIKAGLGLHIQQSYREGKRMQLEEVEQKALPLLTQAVEELRIRHRSLWHTWYRPFGWEVLDLRYGGLLSRIETSMYRLQSFLKGDIDTLEELEEERLKYWTLTKEGHSLLGRNNEYKRIVTAHLI